MTFEQMVDRLKSQFDVAQATVESIVNERQRAMIAESRWRTSQQQITTTVAGQGEYALPYTTPAELVHVSELKVAGTVYEWASETDLWRLAGGDTGLWYAVFNDSTSVAKLQVRPVPDTSGLAITGLVALLPADLAYATATALAVPADVHRHLRAGAQSDLYEEVDERYDLAAARDQVFQEGVLKLRARKGSLIGPRVTRIRVQGRDFV